MNEASAGSEYIKMSKKLLSPTRIRPNWLTSAKGDACFNAEGMEKGEQNAHLCLRLTNQRGDEDGSEAARSSLRIQL